MKNQMEEITEGVNNIAINGGDGYKKNQIQVSNTKKPLFVYVNLAKRYMQQHEEMELFALGMERKIDDSCAVCADTLEWVAYGPCSHFEVCSTCVARLQFICDDRTCCICKTKSDKVFITKEKAHRQMVPLTTTATARHLASSGVDVYTVLAGAVGALYGPLHGGANECENHILKK